LKAQKEKPFKYYFGYAIPNWFSKQYTFFLHKVYEVKCWFFPRNRITFKTLPKTWWDLSEGIVNVNFELLERFMEEEKPLEFIETDWCEESKQTWDEIKFLYSWWKQYKTLEIGYENGEFSLAKEEEQEKEATEMLLRLVKIRQRLWC
jgi:hypothetical protein